jgi:hypothetical protein
MIKPFIYPAALLIASVNKMGRSPLASVVVDLCGDPRSGEADRRLV